MSRSWSFFSCLFVLHAAALAATPCGSLTSRTIPGITVASAAAAAGPFSPGRSAGKAATQRPFPTFCRVEAVARPVADSEIHVEIWLPESAAWNGKLLGTGNGGYSGAIGYADMEGGLRSGYAVTGSDTGHEGSDLKFGLGHLEKIDDWAWRAVHVMTETAKLVTRSYYGRFAAHAYFSGCSTGGQQALTEAQRFPADYDGIVAGAPVNNRVRLNVGFLWSWLASNRNPAAPFPASKLPLIQRAVSAACDQLDGVKDGVPGDPQACRFEPAVLECRGNDAAPAASSSCITDGQIQSSRRKTRFAITTAWSGRSGPDRATPMARLFLIPGMGHCAGGPGPSTFDGLATLGAWVAQETPPSRIVAKHVTNGVADRSRPLCRYAQVARWKGFGSREDAASFDCVAPRAK